MQLLKFTHSSANLNLIGWNWWWFFTWLSIRAPWRIWSKVRWESLSKLWPRNFHWRSSTARIRARFHHHVCSLICSLLLNFIQRSLLFPRSHWITPEIEWETTVWIECKYLVTGHIVRLAFVFGSEIPFIPQLLTAERPRLGREGVHWGVIHQGHNREMLLCHGLFWRWSIPSRHSCGWTTINAWHSMSESMKSCWLSFMSSRHQTMSSRRDIDWVIHSWRSWTVEVGFDGRIERENPASNFTMFTASDLLYCSNAAIRECQLASCSLC